MSGPEHPRIRDPDAPATDAQRGALARLGVDQNFVNDPRLTKGKASELIDEARAAQAKRQGKLPDAGPAPGFQSADTISRQGATGTDESSSAPTGTATTGTAPAPPAAPAPAAAPPESETGVAVYEDESRGGPLTPAALMSEEDRKKYGVAETETVVVRGSKWSIVPELGMPAKFVFARLSSRGGKIDVRLFPSIEGLTFRANAYADGIRSLKFEYLKPEDIPGLPAFLEETKESVIIVRATCTLGNGTTVVEEGTVRMSEIKLHDKTYFDKRQQRMVTRQVANSPVGRTNPLELGKKRALARCLRWGTGFGGTALDELPPDEAAAIAPPPRGA